jgi:hypothetical protein
MNEWLRFEYSTVQYANADTLLFLYYNVMLWFCGVYTTLLLQSTITMYLKVHKIEIFFGFDFEICIISLLVMSKY